MRESAVMASLLRSDVGVGTRAFTREFALMLMRISLFLTDMLSCTNTSMTVERLRLTEWVRNFDEEYVTIGELLDQVNCVVMRVVSCNCISWAVGY